MIYKKKHYESGEFTQFKTEILFDKNLSAVSRVVLIYLLSNKEDWDYSEKNICENFGIKITQLRTALQQLMDNGYVNRTRLYEKGKFKKYIYDIFEDPTQNEKFMNDPF